MGYSDSQDHSENPYRSPEAAADVRADASSIDIFTTTGSFEVGEEKKHAVRVMWSLWSGEEVYIVDDKEVARMRSLDISGVREFDVGEHKVEIRFRTMPFNVVEVYVDGERYIRNLFPRLSRLIWLLGAVIFIPLTLLVAWFVQTQM